MWLQSFLIYVCWVSNNQPPCWLRVWQHSNTKCSVIVFFLIEQYSWRTFPLCMCVHSYTWGFAHFSAHVRLDWHMLRFIGSWVKLLVLYKCSLNRLSSSIQLWYSFRQSPNLSRSFFACSTILCIACTAHRTFCSSVLLYLWCWQPIPVEHSTIGWSSWLCCLLAQTIPLACTTAERLPAVGFCD